MLHRVSCHVPAVPDVFSDADAKNARWSWHRLSLYALMLLALSYFDNFALFSWENVGQTLLQCPFREPPPPPAAAARSPTTLAHIVFVIGASNSTWAKRQVYTGLWWQPEAMRGHVWLDEEPSGPRRASWPPYRVLRPVAARFTGSARSTRPRRAWRRRWPWPTTPSMPIPRGGRRAPMGYGGWSWAPTTRCSFRRTWWPCWTITSESVGQNVAHSYAMAFGGGRYAVSRPTAAALAKIIDGCLDRYNDSGHRVQACLDELGVPLTREPGFHQLDLRGHLYGLLAAHRVAPLLSLHHVDRLSPISPNSLRRLHAVRSLLAPSRHDPSRALQQSICYYSRSRPTGSPRSPCPSPGATWSTSLPVRRAAARAADAAPHVPRVVRLAVGPVHREHAERDGAAVPPPPHHVLPGPRRGGGAVRPSVPDADRVRAGDGAGFDAAAKVQAIQVFAPKMDPAI
ncbi:hypothetical protein ACP70R_017460 [Stipagrostis hirtigluma subsp. patula]